MGLALPDSNANIDVVPLISPSRGDISKVIHNLKYVQDKIVSTQRLVPSLNATNVKAFKAPKLTNKVSLANSIAHHLPYTTLGHAVNSEIVCNSEAFFTELIKFKQKQIEFIKDNFINNDFSKFDVRATLQNFISTGSLDLALAECLARSAYLNQKIPGPGLDQEVGFTQAKKTSQPKNVDPMQAMMRNLMSPHSKAVNKNEGPQEQIFSN